MAKRRSKHLTAEQHEALAEIMKRRPDDLGRAVKDAKAHPLLKGRENSRSINAWKILLRKAYNKTNGYVPVPRGKKEETTVHTTLENFSLAPKHNLSPTKRLLQTRLEENFLIITYEVIVNLKDL